MEKMSYRISPLIKFAAFVIIVAGMKAATMLVVPFLLAAFLSIICAPPLFWMQKKGVPSLLGILILMLGVVVTQILLVTLVSSSIADFSKNIPFYQERLKTLTFESLQFLSRYGVELETGKLAEIFNPSHILKLAANMLNGLGGMLTNTFFVFLTFIFILSEAAGFPNKLRAIFNDKNTDLVKYNEITAGVNRYLGIKTLTSLATGIVISIWLAVQGVDFPVMWGVFAFLLNYIPNIGSIIAAVPAVLLALVQLGPLAAGVASLGFLMVNIVVGSVIEPKVMGQGTGLSALVVFLSLAFWGWVLGPVGMLLSVPLTMAVKIALGGRESTRWLSILLGSNKEAARLLQIKINS
ncbi:MAG: AI-2E family transporter [Proteobacteria bacterium]|nr:AI-2E family transporter [Pseudomonadota bacterium]MBU1585064.1 AI-2E family transporter [Pseudomonadota bacterium]MBU2455871.1 AI-2E family transporter [Pseudomonadota bacterium]MBU2629561.1 AI-2E family transporter [Pseudomonadota bacterium]